jgi:hypothetical protein
MERLSPRTVGARRSTLTLALATLVCAALASPALASSVLKEEFAPFADCPVETAKLCIYSTTGGGQFVIGHKTVPIEKTITLQGGLASELFTSQSLLAAVGGETLSATALTVPGGLVGIAGLGGEVTAVAEIAGPVSSLTVNKGNLLGRSGVALTLPLKIKLSNPTLGNECYIGSDASPITLHLTTGATSPPLPYASISGSRGTLEGGAKGKIVLVKGEELVDNDFAVPGASGCGGALSGVIDPVLDLDVGIPSPAGANTAIMSGSLEETPAVFAAKYKPKPKRKAKG